MRVDTDVCIVGGGPAGSAAALRLLMLGYRTCIIERQGARRAVVTEAFPPTLFTLLDALQIGERMREVGFLQCSEIRMRWGAEEERRQGSYFVADRNRLALALLKAAQSAGAVVLMPATCRKRSFDAAWTIEAEAGDLQHTVTARFLVDASGRRASHAATTPKMLALCGRWRGVSLPARPEMRLAASQRGWLWAVPLLDGTCAISAFVDAGLCAGLNGAARYRLYRELMAEGLPDIPLHRAALAGKIHVRDATCRVAADPVSEHSIKIGDSALAMDPLSSQGVPSAIRSGMQAGVIVNTILQGGDISAALEFYRHSLQGIAARHHDAVARIYASCVGVRSEFWQSRSSGNVGPSESVLPADDALHADVPIRLTPTARLENRPVIEGTSIRRRQSLTSDAGLVSSIAWFGGVEIGPLIEGMRPGSTPASLLSEWSRRMPTNVAQDLMAMLIAERVLIRDTSFAHGD